MIGYDEPVSARTASRRGARGGRFALAGRAFGYISLGPERHVVESTLTRAEAEVARLAAGGHSNAVIARTRKVSARTVANQLASVYRKLGVTSRTELAARICC